jgi:hypothetical protein
MGRAHEPPPALPGADVEGVIVTQVVPAPWETALLPAAGEYNRVPAR